MNDQRDDRVNVFGSILAGVVAGLDTGPDLDANGEPVLQVALGTGHRGRGELDALDRAAGRVVKRAQRRARGPLPDGAR